MRMERDLTQITEEQLAEIGSGQIAYLREISGKEITDAFPGAIEIEPDARVWALFAADGTPIVLADDQGGALGSAFENDLVPLAIH